MLALARVADMNSAASRPGCCRQGEVQISAADRPPVSTVRVEPRAIQTANCCRSALADRPPYRQGRQTTRPPSRGPASPRLRVPASGAKPACETHQARAWSVVAAARSCSNSLRPASFYSNSPTSLSFARPSYAEPYHTIQIALLPDHQQVDISQPAEIVPDAHLDAAGVAFLEQLQHLQVVALSEGNLAASPSGFDPLFQKKPCSFLAPLVHTLQVKVGLDIGSHSSAGELPCSVPDSIVVRDPKDKIRSRWRFLQLQRLDKLLNPPPLHVSRHADSGRRVRSAVQPRMRPERGGCPVSDTQQSGSLPSFPVSPGYSTGAPRFSGDCNFFPFSKQFRWVVSRMPSASCRSHSLSASKLLTLCACPRLTSASSASV